MIERFTARVLLLVVSGSLILPLRSGEPENPIAPTATFGQATNAVHRLAPGPTDGRIAFLTAAMLEQKHYLKRPFDTSTSAKFFNLYLDIFDLQHRTFLQSDVAEFDHYRTNLNRLTLTERHVGDTRPAYEIFNRFLERLEQRTAYVDELLKKEKFTFDTEERITLNRKGLPYPKDLDEAKQLWREQLRFEYLQEKLGKIGAKKKTVALAANKSGPVPQTNALAGPRELPGETKPAVSPAAPKEQRRGVLLSPKQAEQAAFRQPAAPAQAQAKPFAETKTSPAAPKEQRRGVLLSPKQAEQAAFRRPAAPAQTQAKPPAETKTSPAATDEKALRPAPATAAAAAAPPKKTDEEEIVETLSHRYHRNLRFFADWSDEDVLQYYLTALAHVYDPHSDYLGPSQLASFAISMNLSLFGIGAELMSEDGYCRIRRLLPGGPAVKSGKIKESDRIVAVAQGDQPAVDIVDMSLTKAVQLIRGPKGTEVRLTIIPAGAASSTRTVVSLIRDEIALEDSAAKAKIIESADGHGGNLRIGVIDLPSFYATSTFDTTVSKDKPEPRSTTADVARLLTKLKKENVGGIILDLRLNGGGSLEEAIKLTGLFIKTGPVVQVKEVDGNVQEADDTDPAVLYDGPLVVLTSRGSASASEILAGALQDYGRALIVGESSTHGKGTVQSVNPLRPFMHLVDKSLTNDPGALKLTIKKFYRPSGASTQLRGVIPDIVLPAVANESKDIGESALENPLPWDEISSAKYDHLNLVEPYLPELRKHSAERVAADKEFTYVREDIERYKKQQADKTVSLNEKDRLKEIDEIETLNKARDKERLARQDPPEKVYELTLKQADLPGLPPPVAKTNTPVANLSMPALTAPSGASTNLAAATTASSATEDGLEKEPKPPPTDAPLAEAEHILVDYLFLLRQGNVMTAGH